MVDRLTALDASFLTLEGRHTPMHVGQVLIFERPAGLDPAAVVERISARLAANPRLRQRVRSVPGRVANPVWVDDAAFDLDYHVRRSALPAPGSPAQLGEFVARVNAKLLDREHPLWEAYVVEGVGDNHFAVVTKTHQAMIPELTSLDIAGLILDEESGAGNDESWEPRPDPGSSGLLVEAIADAVRSPAGVVDTVRGGLGELRANGRRALGVGATLARAVRSSSDSPLAAEPGTARRFAMVETDLAVYREVRTRLARVNADVNVNDIALAAVAGALRGWLGSRGEFVRATTSLRAVVPVTMATSAGLGGGVHPVFVDLPIGENAPRVRLLQIAHSMRSQVGEAALAADRIAELGGFSAPTLHSLGARVGSALGRRLFDLAVTNVPGPQRQLHCAGAPLIATYPVTPIAPGHALAIGLTSYHGRVFYGLYADREALPDLEVLAAVIPDALAELVETAAT